MSPEAQRIAIAEACGIKWTLAEDGWWDGPNSNTAGISYERMLDQLPDYLADLNAMQSAITGYLNVADSKINWKFCEILGMVTGSGFHVTTALVCATAAQRSEAFLRTLNLWRDDA